TPRSLYRRFQRARASPTYGLTRWRAPVAHLGPVWNHSTVRLEAAAVCRRVVTDANDASKGRPQATLVHQPGFAGWRHPDRTQLTHRDPTALQAGHSGDSLVSGAR